MPTTRLHELLNAAAEATNPDDLAVALGRLRQMLEAEFRVAAPRGTAAGIGDGPTAGSGDSMLQSLSKEIQVLVNSKRLRVRMAGIAVIDELIDLRGEPFREKVQRSYNGLRSVLQKIWDVETVGYAAKTLGHLGKHGGVITTRGVNAELTRAYERLRDTKAVGPDSARTKTAAVLVIKELSRGVPALVYARRNEFLRALWDPVCDQEAGVRQQATQALGALLTVTCERGGPDAYEMILSLVRRIDVSLESGSSNLYELLGCFGALRVILENKQAKFHIMERFAERCGMILRLRNHNDRNVRKAVAGVLPVLAGLRKEEFAQTTLQTSFNFLVSEAADRQHGGEALVALGYMAYKLGGYGYEDYLPRTVCFLRHRLEAPGQDDEARAKVLKSITFLAQSAASNNYIHMTKVHNLFYSLLEPIFRLGFCMPLLECVIAITRSMEQLLDSAQACMLEAAAWTMAPDMTWKSSPEQISTVWNIVAEFDFAGLDPGLLCSFLEEYNVPCMNSAELMVRRAATRAFCRLLGSAAQQRIPGGRLRRDVSALLSRLVAAAVADTQSQIRITAVRGLHRQRNFDEYLAQPECLRELFFCLHDEELSVKVVTVALVARLSEKNPAHALPALRKYLMQLMVALRCEGDVLRPQRSHGAKLLALLIRDSPRLVLPYVHPIMTILVARLKDARDAEDTEAATPVLEAVGYLAARRTTDLSPYLEQLFPVIVECFQIRSAEKEFKKASLKAASALVQNTGCVIEPYTRHRDLLKTILYALRYENDPEVRQELGVVVGTLGAVDPGEFKYAALQHLSVRSSTEFTETNFDRRFAGLDARSFLAKSFTGSIDGASTSGPGSPPERYLRRRPSFREPSDSRKGSETDLSEAQQESLVARLPHPFTGNPEYFPSAALDCLHRVLADKRLTQFHLEAIAAVVSILQWLDTKCAPFLSASLPRILWMLRASDGSGTRDVKFKEYVFKRLGEVVAVARQHIKGYVPDIIVLIRQYWILQSQLLRPIVAVIDALCIALGDEFRPLLPGLLPPMLGVLAETTEGKSAPVETQLQILDALNTFGTHLDDHVALTLPVILKVVEDQHLPIRLRRPAVRVVCRLVCVLPITDLGSCIVHPLTRCLVSDHSSVAIDAAEALYNLAHQIRADFGIFVPWVRAAAQRNGVQHTNLEKLLAGYEKSESRSGPTAWSAEEEVSHSASLDTKYTRSATKAPRAQMSTSKKMNFDVKALRRAWEVGRRNSREDWNDWLQAFGSALFQQSGSPALRSCAQLAEVYPPLAMELFNSAFLSCWTELQSSQQSSLVNAIETALSSETLPPNILQILLSLAEFMEHDEKPLPIDLRTLASMASRCGAYAKALHYKEAEYGKDPLGALAGDDGLISIYHALGQPESASGAMIHAGKVHGIPQREEWFEKLHRWDEALLSYEKLPPHESPRQEWERKLSQIRCLDELGEWKRMEIVSKEAWALAAGDKQLQIELASGRATSGALIVGDWTEFAKRVEVLPTDAFDGNYFRAILACHLNHLDDAALFVHKARQELDDDLKSQIGEGYPRAYDKILQAQLLVELDESIALMLNFSPENKSKLAAMWRSRLAGCRRDHLTWYKTLAVRMLVLTPEEMKHEILDFADLCRVSGRNPMAGEALRMLLPSGVLSDDLRPTLTTRISEALENVEDLVVYSFGKYLWDAGRQVEAFDLLQDRTIRGEGMNNKVLSRCLVKLSGWSRSFYDDGIRGSNEMNRRDIEPRAIVDFAFAATKADPSWYKAWRTWALVNADAASNHESDLTPHENEPRKVTTAVKDHVLHAIRGFFQAIERGSGRNHLQDTLRLLTLWFKFGKIAEVTKEMDKGSKIIDPTLWLEVVPQMIARLQNPVPEVRSGLKYLLIRIGEANSQALIYPITVASNSGSEIRQSAANEILETMRTHSAALVDQAAIVSKELIRVAILWQEMWHEALEDASRLYFGENNVEGMYETLAPLHRMMDAGPETSREAAFLRDYGPELREAADWCNRYRASGRDADINQAWDAYYHVFRKISKQLNQLTTLELVQVSPSLLDAKSLELAVPGSAAAWGNGSDGRDVGATRIASFAPTLTVINSKQRPRKLTILGSDGKDHVFLLKGHEDLRQDERVMQLFGLVNELFVQSKSIATSKDLNITRFSVVPLSQNSGLIGWVPDTDTLHSLVRDFREQRKILLNVEHRLMLQMAPEYDNLSLLAKVECFEYALANTTGADIARVMWLKSRNSEMWVDRRTNYIKSMATMSIVGYILGLGDRHPSNLLLERTTGKILHIDFGDCFEVAMHREKYPEKIPFRLTRMLVQALEVCQVDGYFRHTCETVMTVLRHNKESLMAMLEAFVHDPLINWRLMAQPESTNTQLSKSPVQQATGDSSAVRMESIEAPEDEASAAQRTAAQGLNQKVPFDQGGGKPTARAYAVGLRNGSIQSGPKSLSRQIFESGSNSLLEYMQAIAARDKGWSKIEQQISGAMTMPTPSQNSRRAIRRSVDVDGDALTVGYTEAVDKRAASAVRRVNDKLTGRDFSADDSLEVPDQVNRLITQATDTENLCQCYIGWCAFW